MRCLALIAVLPLAACSFHDGGDPGPGVAAGGGGTARSFAVADFTGIDLRGADDVDVRTGGGFSVRAEGPAAELDRLRIEKVGDALRIGRSNSADFGWGGSHDGVKLFVTMPRIAAAAIAGSGDMRIDRVEGEGFKGESAGSGSLTIAAMAVRSAELSIAGSGGMRLAGTAKRLSVNIAGSGGVKAGDLKAERATVSVAGSGGVEADVAGPAEVSVMGSGAVDLGSNARCTTSKLGSGTVRCGA